ncbi:hypothetical protein ACLVWU_04850 [Bdellovibrio sp. HCB290]|uniref:hypothetical protein n=1 Tax=Bdellovibrio sp. HCB290 TaxID=3394356 RepID=UPI0039B676E4
MKQFANLNESKGLEKRYRENRLSPITISGVIVPWEKTLSDGSRSEYKFDCGNCTEYLILENSEVRDVLPFYCWKEVKIVGLLNRTNMTLIPQKVIPQGPGGESTNVIDFSVWKNPKLKWQVLNKINDLVVIPAAVFAVLAS